MKAIITGIIALIISLNTFAQSISFTNTDGKAIKGYDPVAYFTEQKAIEGKTELVYEWNGSKWLFSSQANLDAFKVDPEKFAPQYGGFCAYGTSENHLSPTDPNAWTVVDGKLYLNYNKKVKELWSKDIPSRIKKADEYWNTLKNSKNN
ncbi:MAG: YHS domain protein [Cytophagaceae bacterium BCCC1]|nr:MAG: YHS domain protein [Cytophagaceae bacterium BCCC1]